MATEDETRRSAVRAQIQEDQEEHIERLQRMIRQPSLSVDGVGLEETAELAVDLLDEAEFDEAELVRTEGAPGVWGRLDEGADKTVITYGMLDTRLVLDEEKWDHPPFAAERTVISPFGEVIVGRITSKAAFVGYINTLEAVKKALGSLPVNVMVLAEVEEINGSPHYYEMLEQYEDEIRTADACLGPSFSQNTQGDVTASLGYKSAIYFDLQVSGESWERGPQGGDIHAMSNSVVDAPAWRFIDALASLTDENGTEISVEGFYDQYEPPTEAERQEVRELIDELGGGEDLWQSLPGLGRGSGRVPRLKNELQDDVEEAFIQSMYSPESFNIQGLRSGFLGPKTNTKPFRLPNKATATFDVRLPRGYDPDVTLRQIREHLDEQGFEDVELDVAATHRWQRTDREADLVTAVHEVLTRNGADVTYWPYSSGGVPWAAFGSRYEMPVLHGVGLGYHGSDGHDEFISIDGNDEVASLVEAETVAYELLATYAQT